MLLAASDGAVVAIGGIILTGLITIGVVILQILGNRVGRKVEAAVGVPNGKGNVVQMTEQVLNNITRLSLDVYELSVAKRTDHEKIIAAIDEVRQTHGAHLAAAQLLFKDVQDQLKALAIAHGERLDRLEQEHQGDGK